MFKKTYVAPYTRNSAPLSQDALYWKNFTAPIFLKEINLIDYIDVSPIEPHFVAVTCSSRIQLYHPITRMIHKNYNRFREAAYGGVFRNDGKLLLSGSDECELKLFDVSNKNLLRVYKGHESPIHRCAFMPTDNHIVSFSDDKTLIQWDMSNEAIIHKYEGHNDYIRSGAVTESNPYLIFSGSYDHTVKVWDKRDHKELFAVNHGAPVESILPSVNGTLLFTAGGTDIKVWDCLAGGRLLAKISQHHKTITCLRFGTNYKRLLSSSLDRHVKVYDMSSFEVIHTYDYSSPILSLGISPDDKTLIVGMTDGIIAISRREDKIEGEVEQKVVEEIKSKRKKSKNFSDFVQTDFGIREETLAADTKYDQYLRKFRYSKALDVVLAPYYYNQMPGTTVALFQELIRRDGLKSALAGREGNQIKRVLQFLLRYVRKPKFMRILVEVANILIDLYASKIGQDPSRDALFLELCDVVNKEVNYMTDLMEIQGSLEMIIAGSNKNTIKSLTNISSASLRPSDSAKQALIVSL